MACYSSGVDPHLPSSRRKSAPGDSAGTRDENLKPPYSRCSFSMKVKSANDGLLQANDGKMLVNDGQMLVNDGEISVWYTHFTIIDEYFTIISLM